MINRNPNMLPRRAKNELIVSVGSHAHIHWSEPVGNARASVPITDGSGQVIDSDLADGDEVEILSWRQRSCAGMAYQIRRLSDGSEWWIAATYLRRGRMRADLPMGARA